MAKQTITRRQKDVARLLRERKEAYPEKIRIQKASAGAKVWDRRGG